MGMLDVPAGLIAIEKGKLAFAMHCRQNGVAGCK
jgi:hypothetical protein